MPASTFDPFFIRGHVPDFDSIGEEYQAMSAATLARWPSIRDIAYGATPAERLDLFVPQGARNAPVHVFIHGGYWRSGSKELFAFVADTVCAAGAIAVLVEYGLLPRVRMPAIVDQVRRSLAWVEQHIAVYGGDRHSISISGHSAGAHLASFVLAKGCGERRDGARPAVRSALLVSGIYELAPIPRSFLQPEILLTEAEIRDWTPLDSEWPREVPVTIAVGEEETAPFQAQSKALESKLNAFDVRVDRMVVRGENHMTVVRSLGRRNTEMSAALVACISRSTGQG